MGYPDWQSTNTLADLISAALAATGLPVVSNPIARFDIQSPPPAGTPGPFGGTLFGGGQSAQIDTQSAQTQIGRLLTACRVYYNDNGTSGVYTNSSQFPDQLAAAFALGMIAVVSYKPAFSGTTGPNNLPSPAQMQTDQNAMKASLNSIIAAGFPAANLRVVIWHEANFQPNGVSAAQYLNLYNGLASGGQSNYTALHAICPVYSIMLGNQPPTSQEIINYPPITPTLPANACDALLVDWYEKPYSQGQWLGGPVTGGGTTWDAVARAANVKLGVGEFGGVAKFTIDKTVQYLLSSSITINGTVYPGDSSHSLAAVMQSRMAANLANAEVMLFWDFSNNATFPPGFTQVLAALNDALTVPSAQSLGAGQSVTLTPLNPSPVAGYASATGMSYDILINAISSAPGSTSPYLNVTFSWYNDDSPTALAVAIQKWSIPIGANGTAGTVITGSGPQYGKYWAIQLHNNDTVGVSYTVQGNSTGRTVRHHDWRWPAPDSVNVPDPNVNLAGGSGSGNSLGALSSVSVAAGASKSFLFGLAAAEVSVRFAAFGAAATNTVKFSLFPKPGSRWQNVPTYATYLPLGAAAFQQEINDITILPRGPMMLTVTNNDANGITFDAEIVALEP